MRIIAGDLKGRRLFTPADRRIRPTTDKVKEALFSIAAPYICDAVVIDLFSGTGNLGLEAISRGAEKVYFGDQSKSSIALTIKNVQHCDVGEQAVILHGDYETVLKRIPERADLVFLDPPYKKGLMDNCFQLIDQLDLLEDEGIIIAEHGEDQILPDYFHGFTKLKHRCYGNIVLSIYSKETTQ